MQFVAKDILSYRYPISGSLREFDTQLDVLSGRPGAPVSGLYTVYLPIGHAADTPLESVAITPWRSGTSVTGNDVNGYAEFTIYQVPTVETKREDDLTILAVSPRVQMLRDYDVIELELRTGTTDYMRPIFMSVMCYWDDTANEPVWLNVREILVTLMFEGQTRVPEKVSTKNPAAIFEVYRGRNAQLPDPNASETYQ